MCAPRSHGPIRWSKAPWVTGVLGLPLKAGIVMPQDSKPRTRLTARLALASTFAVLTVGVLGGTSASAAAEPVSDGCPPSFQRLSLVFLASQGPYQQPFTIDATGNNNGYVCGKPVNEAAYEAVCGSTCPVPVLYNFIDDKIAQVAN